MSTDRSRVRRVPSRGRYERETINAILDDALVAHVGFVEDGQPYVIPMAVARDNDRLLLHGSAASRLMRRLSAGVAVCVTVTHLDGVVVSRSIFDSSMNYRSVVLLGTGTAITESLAKRAALQRLVEHLLPGRWHEARPPSDKEMRATLVLAVSIDEASAKVRSGPPQDDLDDLSLTAWAGEIPLRMLPLPPVADPALAEGIEVPRSVHKFVWERRERAAASLGDVSKD
jgi:nitroimidazol reductase NimA-like FMN-containing flavoprotein (pyridoxamine 5'-phosphate oxidase superfamily)